MERENVNTAQSTPQIEPQNKGKTGIVQVGLRACAKRAFEWVKSTVKIETVLCILFGLFVLHCVADGISQCCNYYMTPIKISLKISNSEMQDIEDMSLEMWNGLAHKQLKKIAKVMHNSESYMEAIEWSQYVAQENYKEYLGLYGEDVSQTVTELYRIPLSSYELSEYRGEIREYIFEIGYLVDESEEYKSVDWRELAYELDLTKDQAKELIKAYGEFVDEMEPIQVTEGYELHLQYTTTGALLEEPQVTTQDVTVIKLNGRWVLLDTLEAVSLFFEMLD